MAAAQLLQVDADQLVNLTYDRDTPHPSKGNKREEPNQGQRGRGNKRGRGNRGASQSDAQGGSYHHSNHQADDQGELPEPPVSYSESFNKLEYSKHAQAAVTIGKQHPKFALGVLRSQGYPHKDPMPLSFIHIALRKSKCCYVCYEESHPASFCPLLKVKRMQPLISEFLDKWKSVAYGPQRRGK